MPNPDKPTTDAAVKPSQSELAPPPVTPASPPPNPPAEPFPAKRRHWGLWVVAALVLVVVLFFGVPWIIEALNTVSTDDAYVNGHVTFLAPRVPGQVMRVFVDDNNRVHKGDILVELDKEPYQVQVNIAQAAVDAAQSDLTLVQAQVRAQEAATRSLRFNLEHSIEDVDNQVALLRSKAAALNSEKATLDKAQSDYNDALPLLASGGVAKEEVDRRKETLLVAQANVEQALQAIYQVRVSLGLPPTPEGSSDLTQVPSDLDQTFSAVRQAQMSVAQSAASIGVFESFNLTPKEMVAQFYKRDPDGDIDKIYAQITKDAPSVKQAETKLAVAQRNLDQANLNLRYCDVVSEIDGVVTRRDVNPGNNVVAGQSLMAVRSLTEIWIDANFKETQLASLRIGQPVDIDTDIYGGHEKFKGRITGFTEGTGSTLALLPPENATGNFVKVVQRLPVRIELTDYDPDKMPLFIGLSVTPEVHIDQSPAGPDAGKVLQPYLPGVPTTEPSSSSTSAPGTQP